jgi:MSHA biogenesis protein MshI
MPLRSLWPWPRRREAAAGAERLAIACEPGRMLWLHGDAAGRPLRAGIEPLAGGEDAAGAQRPLRALGLPTRDVTALLGLGEAQLLQIEAPAVRPEELKSAARWRIKEFVETRLEELTIDVMHVGRAHERAHERAAAAPRQLFVVAARNALLQDIDRRGRAQGLALSVIDITEMAQRNLQHAAATAAGLGERATAALMRHGDKALLTLCAGGELYYARQLDWDAAGLETQGTPLKPDAAADFEGLDFIDYGAADAQDDAGAPRLVVEVQRSLDVWERTWPDLPVARLWVHAGEAGAALAMQLVARLAPALNCPVHRLETAQLAPGFAEAAPTAELRDALWPLLGALRRQG